MINMAQRVQLHRILDDCISYNNMGNTVNMKFEGKEQKLFVEFHNSVDDTNPTTFMNLPFTANMFYSNLLSIAELLEREMEFD